MFRDVTNANASKMKITLLLAALALCTAIPSETENSEAHEEAKSTIAKLVQMGKSDNACRDLAETTIKEIKNSVATLQKESDALDTGHSCGKAEKAAVIAAKKEKATADKKKKAATTARKKACNAKVTFAPRSFNSLKDKTCDTFFSDTAYLTAAKKCTKAKSAEAEAEGAAKAAGDAIEAAEKLAEEETRKCQCKAKHASKKHSGKLAKFNSGDNAAAWRKAHHLLCVLDGKSSKACRVPDCPTVKPKKLAKDVKKAVCAQWKLVAGKCPNLCDRKHSVTLKHRLSCYDKNGNKAGDKICKEVPKPPIKGTTNCPPTKPCCRISIAPYTGTQLGDPVRRSKDNHVVFQVKNMKICGPTYFFGPGKVRKWAAGCKLNCGSDQITITDSGDRVTMKKWSNGYGKKSYPPGAYQVNEGCGSITVQASKGKRGTKGFVGKVSNKIGVHSFPYPALDYLEIMPGLSCRI